MLKVGLTGGIGTGKTSVAKWLKQQGILVFDADAFVHELLDSNAEIRDFLLDEFGKALYIAGSKQLDRKRIAQRAFVDNAFKSALEFYIHPKVHEAINNFFHEHADHVLAVADVPLIFETGNTHFYDEIWLVYTPAETQLKRMIEGRGMIQPDVERRLKAQLPIDSKKELADRIIDNSQNWEDTEAQLSDLLSSLNLPTSSQVAS